MTEDTQRKAPTWYSLIAISIIAILGYQFGKYLAISGFEAIPAFEARHAFALALSVIYIFFGVFMALAAALPPLRKLSWTQADAEDIEINQRLYVLQGASAAAWGVSLLMLALGGDGLLLGSRLAAVLSLIAFVAGLVTYWRSLGLMDELFRMTTLESAAWTYGLVLTVVGIWAAMAHLELATPPAMLTIVTMFWALALAGSIVASARRGMLSED